MLTLALLGLLGCAHREPSTPRVAEPRPPEFTAVYSLRVGEGASTPAGLDAAMLEYYDVRMLVAFGRGPGDTNAVLLAPAAADGLSQDRCFETTAWPAVPIGPDGALSVQDRALVFGADGTQGTMGAVSLSGVRAPDHLRVDRLTGLVDTRPLVSRMGSNLAPDAFCNFLPAFGPCQPCPDGSGVACWSLTVEEVTAPLVQAAVEPRDREAICADPACASQCPAK